MSDPYGYVVFGGPILPSPAVQQLASAISSGMLGEILLVCFPLSTEHPNDSPKGSESGLAPFAKLSQGIGRFHRPDFRGLPKPSFCRLLYNKPCIDQFCRLFFATNPV